MSDAGPDLLLLHALADQELDAATALALERRIAAEPALAAEYERIIAVKEAVTRVARPAVSRDFLDRMAALPAAGAAGPTRQEKPSARWQLADWRAMAASIVLTAFLASGGTYLMTASNPDASIETAVASGHRRSLLASSPFDIASSDRHTVKPWLDAKLGLSPPTPDLAAAGFPLVGGRVDVLAGRAVPVIVYKRHAHLISVVAIPVDASERSAPVATSTDGYNMVRWSGGGFRYLAVSDLDMGELKTFADDLRVR